MRYIVLLLCYVFASFGFVFGSGPVCRVKNLDPFLNDLTSQCPCGYSPSPLILQMDGDSLDKHIQSSKKSDFTAVLFYASWCHFSTDVKSKFVALSSIFPQITHVVVDQSKAMPSVFSRYGIHSVPAILIVNQTERVRYHGPQSLVNFYKRTTGLEPVVYVVESQIEGHKAFQWWKASSLRELLSREPYLVLSVAFLLFRACLYLLPGLVAHVAALWFTYVPHLNIGIFGESRQLLGRVFHMVDLKRAWSKLKVCKTRNFHKGARNARVWASSLTSVSLGEASSARVFPSGDS